MFSCLAKPSSIIFVKNAIKFFSKKHNLAINNESLWVLVGSYVINGQSASSDLDLLYITDDNDVQTKRLETEYNGVPASITLVPKKSLVDDGRQRLYGGYFSGKLLNPHILFHGNSRLRQEVYKSAGHYIGPSAGYLSLKTGRNKFTAEAISAQVAIAFIAFNPDYDSYLLSYFVNDKFNKLWNRYVKNNINCLEASKSIKKHGKSFIYTDSYKNFEQFNRERMRSSVRHWSFGVSGHNGDFRFPDKYFKNADKKKSRLSPDGVKMRKLKSFLMKKSGLKMVYY